MTDSQPWDVVIVGGRPAGASLAVRLGARGYRVLLLDRSTFPSLPAVPSSPVLYPSAIRLLDEIGVHESSYMPAVHRHTHVVIQFAEIFDTLLEVPPMGGRAYVLGLDRYRFDDVVWRNVARFPSVTQREGFAVSDVVRDAEGRVVGVVGAERGGPSETITARCVVGADGRFSLVARKVGARVVDEETEHVSTVYYANWENVAPFRPGLEGAASINATGRGLDVLMFCMPDGLTSINTHQRADRVELEGDAQGYYRSTLERMPAITRRIAGARQVGELVGMKRVGNGYREASGPGWVLVGDAVHYKDPVDGQGIYDALLGARLLDEALATFLTGERPWATAMADYARGLREATHPMYRETLGRLRRELYQEPPTLVVKTALRWLMTDSVYQRRFLQYLGRDIPVEGWLSPGLVGGAILRGIGRDLRGLLGRSNSNAASN